MKYAEKFLNSGSQAEPGDCELSKKESFSIRFFIRYVDREVITHSFHAIEPVAEMGFESL